MHGKTLDMAAAVEAWMGPPQVVRVKRGVLMACMTCPLCNKLLVEATTISECLHTFCRKCIFEKLTDEEVDCCPICNIDLGCVPVEKLRPDHSLQDVRSKIFPLKRRKVGAPDVPSITLPVRRKERSLSSLVVNTPRVATQRGFTGRRTKAFTRRVSGLRRLSPIITGGTKKEDDSVEDHADHSSSHENLSKIIQSRRHLKNSSNLEVSNRSHSTEKCGQSFPDKADLWKPLNCLVEAANRTKTLKSSPQSPNNAEQTNGSASEVHSHKSKPKKQSHKSKIQEDENGLVKVKAKRLNAISRKRRDLRASAQALVDAAVANHERRACPVWLSLVASFDEQGESLLPQIDASYLRIKDGDLPVSFIHKFLVRKLNLSNEAEVEIRCRTQPVSPMLALNNLVDLWLQQGSSQSERIQASVGASAKEFVMVLTYNRKALVS